MPDDASPERVSTLPKHSRYSFPRASVVGLLLALVIADDAWADPVRFRFGAGGGGGVLFATRRAGEPPPSYQRLTWVLSVPEIRFGAQFTRAFGAYLDLRPQLVSLGFVPVARLMFAAVLLDHLELAFGPGIGQVLPFGGSTIARPGEPPIKTQVFTPMLRSSVIVGSRNRQTGTRRGFAMSASVAPYLGDYEGWIFTTGVSYELY